MVAHTVVVNGTVYCEIERGIIFTSTISKSSVTSQRTSLRISPVMGGHDRKDVELFSAHAGKLLLSVGGRPYYDKKRLPCDDAVITATLSSCGRFAVVATHTKRIIVFDCTDRETVIQINEHTVPKRPTYITFTVDDTFVIVSDAFGDVYKFCVRSIVDKTGTKATSFEKHIDSSDKDEDKKERNCKVEEDDDDDDENSIIVGHFSTVICLTMTNDRIVTCDRDARVRVSRYPDAFVIESFCLGHSDVVTSVSAVPNDSHNKNNKIMIISGSLDKTIRLWDACDGTLISTLHVDKGVAQVCCIGKNDAVFVTMDGHEVRHVHGLVAEMETTLRQGRDGGDDGGVIHRFGMPVRSMTVDGMMIYVTLEGESVPQVHWIDFVSKESGCIGLQVEDNDQGDNDAKADKAKETMIGRFEWLRRQKKKEMVSDWKGKKRRHLDLHKSSTLEQIE